MSHTEQREFVNNIKVRFPEHFWSKRVLEVGSYNINGTVRTFFEECQYIGIDICSGPGVDIVCSGHDFSDKEGFDTVITCEMMEHNLMWKETLINMVQLLRSHGLFILTCGTTGRGVHGTASVTPVNSPSSAQYGDYYGNLTEQDIRSVIDIEGTFKSFGFETNTVTCDLYMWGIKE
jgi:hypothetical protein